ncbi:MAG: recombinase family protein [Candidatus Obscuribacter sp.]|nr:recombinase family protein [Candidatus Obscuribacter sp.]
MVGYARVSTGDQNIDLQADALKSAGCRKIFSEKLSGKNTDRPELAKLLDNRREGDTYMSKTNMYHPALLLLNLGNFKFATSDFVLKQKLSKSRTNNYFRCRQIPTTLVRSNFTYKVSWLR